MYRDHLWHRPEVIFKTTIGSFGFAVPRPPQDANFPIFVLFWSAFTSGISLYSSYFGRSYQREFHYDCFDFGGPTDGNFTMFVLILGLLLELLQVHAEFYNVFWGCCLTSGISLCLPWVYVHLVF